MYDIKSIKDKLNELGISPKKSLGQNFLIYQKTIEKIVASVPENDVEQIVEIGPGLGALTYLLKDLNKDLLLIELDNAFANFWQQEGFSVEHIDALKFDWSNRITKPTALVSNLPYQISSSIVIDMSTLDVPVSAMILMFQKEVAARIMAKYGGKEYGLLSVIAQTFWEIELVLEAGPKDFYPPPTIASQVLKFRRKEVNIENKRAYLRLVKEAFKQRRKKVINNISSSTSHLDIKTLWQELGFTENLRAENLSIDDYIKLFLALK